MHYIGKNIPKSHETVLLSGCCAVVVLTWMMLGVVLVAMLTSVASFSSELPQLKCPFMDAGLHSDRPSDTCITALNLTIVFVFSGPLLPPSPPPPSPYVRP